MLPSPRDISTVTIPAARRDRPGQPYPSIVDADDAEPGELRHERPRELGAVPVVVDHREHVGVDEGAHAVADRAGLVGEQLVEQVVVGAHDRFPSES